MRVLEGQVSWHILFSTSGLGPDPPSLATWCFRMQGGVLTTDFGLRTASDLPSEVIGHHFLVTTI